MINNYRAILVGGMALLLAGCEPAPRTPGFAGVVELDERLLSFELSGRIATVTVQRGDSVRAGQPLATLDPRLEIAARDARAKEVEGAEAQVSAVEAGAKQADVLALAADVKAASSRVEQLARDLARDRALLSENVLPRAAVDSMQAQLDQATWQRASLQQRLSSLQQGARKEEIEVARAKARALDAGIALSDQRVARHELLAPVDGVVTDVHAKIGEVLAAGVPVISFGEPSAPWVEVFVPQGDLAGIEHGVAATVRVDAYDKPFSGRVDYVYPRTEFTPRYSFSEQERPNLVVRVRVQIDDPETELPTGVPAFVVFERAPAP